MNKQALYIHRMTFIVPNQRIHSNQWWTLIIPLTTVLSILLYLEENRTTGSFAVLFFVMC